MGGAVGLKGTDGTTILQEAIRRGARPVSSGRAKEFLSIIGKKHAVSLVVAEGQMGADIARELGLKFVPIDHVGPTTTKTDTIRIARSMPKHGIDILAFVRGAGPATYV